MEVTAFSGSENKKELAMELGAKHFSSSTNIASLEKEACSYDVIIHTLAFVDDETYKNHINLVRPRGTAIIVGIPEFGFKALVD